MKPENINETIEKESRALLTDFESFEDWFATGIRLIGDQLNIAFELVKGFTDNGKSAIAAFKLIDKDWHLSEWLSVKSLDFIYNMTDQLMVYFDLLQAEKVA